MKYDTINDGDATPLQILENGYSMEDGSSGVAPRRTNNTRTSSRIVRAVLVVGTAVVAVGALLLLLAGPSKMLTTMNASSCWNCVSPDPPPAECTPATGRFYSLSCKSSDGYHNVCVRDGHGWDRIPLNWQRFQTCYVSNNAPPNDRCWSRSHTVTSCGITLGLCTTSYQRCDPVGYLDGDQNYNKDGVWHVQRPLPDGTCGNPCQEFRDYNSSQ